MIFFFFFLNCSYISSLLPAPGRGHSASPPSGNSPLVSSWAPRNKGLGSLPQYRPWHVALGPPPPEFLNSHPKWSVIGPGHLWSPPSSLPAFWNVLDLHGENLAGGDFFSFPSSHGFKDRMILNDIPQPRESYHGRNNNSQRPRKKRQKKSQVSLHLSCAPLLDFCPVRAAPGFPLNLFPSPQTWRADKDPGSLAGSFCRPAGCCQTWSKNASPTTGRWVDEGGCVWIRDRIVYLPFQPGPLCGDHMLLEISTSMPMCPEGLKLGDFLQPTERWAWWSHACCLCGRWSSPWGVWQSVLLWVVACLWFAATLQFLCFCELPQG